MIQMKKGGLPTHKALAIVRPSVIATTFSGRSEKYFKLQRINAILSGLYFIQAALIWLFSHTVKVPITLNYMSKDALQSAALEKNVLVTSTHQWFDINLAVLVGGVLICAAIFHGLLATALRARYERGLSQKLQDLRWIAYALIGGLLTILVMVAMGVSDAALLMTLFMLCVVVSLGTLAVEANNKFWPWSAFGIVGMAGVIVVISMQLIGGFIFGSALSWYTYIAVGLLITGGVGVVANLYLQVHKVKDWSDYLFAEEGYMALNFIISSSIAWVLFAGVLR